MDSRISGLEDVASLLFSAYFCCRRNAMYIEQGIIYAIIIDIELPSIDHICTTDVTCNAIWELPKSMNIVKKTCIDKGISLLLLLSLPQTQFSFAGALQFPVHSGGGRGVGGGRERVCGAAQRRGEERKIAKEKA